jgi:hypothetical protein
MPAPRIHQAASTSETKNPRSQFSSIFRTFSLSKIPPMKKLSLLVFLVTLKLNAQTYSFMQLTDPYVELTSATTLTTSTPWTYASAFTVPIGFTFNFMGSNFTTVYAEGSGFTYFDFNYYYLSLPFMVKLKSKGTSGNNSPISYETSGSAGSRILKIQWKNAGFHYDTTSTINFQMWLYETTNIVEVHIGPNDVPNPSMVYQENGSDGPVVGVYRYSSASNCAYSACLSGNASAAMVNNLTGSINLFGTSITGTPADSTVYKFDPSLIGVGEYNSAAFTISNLSSEFVIINSESSVENCTLYSLDGKTTINRQPVGQQLFIGDLPAGMYILEAQFAGVVSRQKLVISH